MVRDVAGGEYPATAELSEALPFYLVLKTFMARKKGNVEHVPDDHKESSADVTIRRLHQPIEAVRICDENGGLPTLVEFEEQLWDLGGMTLEEHYCSHKVQKAAEYETLYSAFATCQTARASRRPSAWFGLACALSNRLV